MFVRRLFLCLVLVHLFSHGHTSNNETTYDEDYYDDDYDYDMSNGVSRVLPMNFVSSLIIDLLLVLFVVRRRAE